MTFRDYAQGSFRMRGVGRGQTIHLFLIPEVENRMRQELGTPTGRVELDVTGWLLINSMRMEGLQFIQMSLQELFNVWRKRALATLTDEVSTHTGPGAPRPQTSDRRLQRFSGAADGVLWLRRCVQLFREPVGYPVPDCVPVPHTFHDKLDGLVSENRDFMQESWESEHVAAVASKVRQVSECQWPCSLTWSYVRGHRPADLTLRGHLILVPRRRRQPGSG